MPGSILFFCFKWFGKTIPIYDDLGEGFSGFFTSIKSYYFDTAFEPPIMARLLGSFVDVISLSLFLVGCFYVIKILDLYQKGEVFSKNILLLFKRITRVAFWGVIYAPFKVPFLSVITTCFHNEPGTRKPIVSFTSNDAINIFLLGCLYVITSIMYQGYKLKKEHDLTV